MLEQDEKMAYVQTPQYYTNFQENRIARAASLQQIIFYEYICSGKGIRDAMVCCGSNVLIRTDALIDVGGFDETTVTEDFATSLRFHLNGWKTQYYNKVGVFGMGPEDMKNYFKQQARWAMGAAELLKQVIVNFIKNPFKLSLIKWWEYFLSTSFYFSSFTYAILWICPILYLLFDVPSFFANPIVYGAILMPYFILSTVVFYWTLIKRHYEVKHLLKGQFLLWISFPVLMKASIKGLFGKKKKKKFEVTERKIGKAYPYSKLLPQLFLGLVCFISIVWGFNKIYYTRHDVVAILINIFWIFYTFTVMSYVFYFNVSKEIMKKDKL
jgi:cellulose synthase (UDP-forming)